MNEMLIENWNSVVGEDDTVYHLGDVGLGPWEDWDNSLSRLNGHKILVIGNHDRLFKGGYGEIHRAKFEPVYRQWFEEIYPSLGTGLYNGSVVNLSHFPYDGDHTEEDRYSEYRLPDKGITLLHGHTHLNQIISHSKEGSLQIHVGQDAWDYTPVSEDQIVALLEGLE